MNRFVKYIMFTLLTFILVGCSASKEGKKQIKSEAMGRYVETNCKLEEYIKDNGNICLWKDEKEQLHALIQNEDLVDYVLTEAGEWKPSESEICELIQNNFKDIDRISVIQVQEDGSYYISGYAAIASGNMEEAGFFDAFLVDGKVKLVGLEEDSDVEAEVCAVDKKGNMIVSSGETGILSVFNKEGKKQQELTDESAEPIILRDRVFCLGDGILDIYNIKTGNKEKTIENIDAQGYTGKVFTNDKEDAIFIANWKGVTRINEEGTIVEKIIDGKLCSLSSYRVIQGMSYKDKLYLVYLDYDKYNIKQLKVKEYSYSEDMPTVPDDVLTVWTPCENLLLSKAVEIYRKKYPDKMIRLESFYDSSEWEEKRYEMSSQDIEELNKEILVGTGPDVMMLDMLPVESYLKQDIFVDLTECVDSVDEPLLENVARAYQNEKGIYAIPLKFSMLLSIGEKELVGDGFSLEKFARYQEEHPNEEVLFGINKQDRINILMDLWKDKLFDSENKLDKNAMISYLTSLKSIIPKNNSSWVSDWATEWRTEYYPESALLSELMKADIVKVGSMAQLQCIEKILEERPDCVKTDIIEGEKNIIEPQSIIAITKNSKRQEEAKNFIKIALSEEVQGSVDTLFSFNRGGMPVNLNALTDSLIYNNHMKEVSGEDWIVYARWTNADGEGIGLEAVTDEFRYPEKMKAYLEQCKTAKVSKPIDEMIRNIISEEALKYLNDEIPLDQAVGNIEEKMNLYRMEQTK